MHRIASSLLGFCAMGLAGCATTTLPKGVASSGYTEVVSVPIGPLRYFHTASLLPGRTDVGTTHVHLCANTERSISLQIADGLGIAAEDVCSRIDAAAALAESWIPAESNSYRILLAPEGTAGAIQARSLGRFATGRTLALASHVYPDQQQAFADLVDLVAHESLHALGHATKHRRARDERSAYYAGLCAQLRINGLIREASLPGAPLASADPAVRTSSQQAYRVRLETYPLLVDGTIRLGTPSGASMLQRCQQIGNELIRLQ
ncbi:hypothetical protein [Stenotrophomonas sp.]|uniref:hypothetical protein n=1 Tax=Stenotrophomonas sp. TaxID=69392 RepID=UPI0028AE7041|nr:hypothetical protein [Stenotrophomonas sp.]